MLRILAIAVLTLMGISSCWATNPLAEFETIIKLSQASVPKEGYVEFAQSSKTKYWGRMVWTIEGIRYDVRKTDSLVTPFVGVVSFDVLERWFNYASEADARLAVHPKEKKEHVALYVFRMNYGYQANDWRFNSGEGDMAFIGDSSELASAVNRRNLPIGNHKFTSNAELLYFGVTIQTLLRPWLL